MELWVDLGCQNEHTLYNRRLLVSRTRNKTTERLVLEHLTEFGNLEGIWLTRKDEVTTTLQRYLGKYLFWNIRDLATTKRWQFFLCESVVATYSSTVELKYSPQISINLKNMVVGLFFLFFIFLLRMKKLDFGASDFSSED